ncbi:MAG: hypothetical protein IJ562_11455 [Prevotella sp.]|nr:hypothetical protein [Prevotella sp.]
MIVVIADDLTGAAEMGGIAWSHGLHVSFSLFNPNEYTPVSICHSLVKPERENQVLVIATDTRSLSVTEARTTIEAILSRFTSCEKSHILFYKKTDSALRGHIIAELSTMMQCLQIEKTLLLAQNPSKKRIVSNGEYSINGIPLCDTDFRHDPEFPAKSSQVEKIVCHNDFNCCYPVYSIPVKQPTLTSGIAIADAATKDDIIQQLSKTDNHTIIAGGADLFEMLLELQVTSVANTNKAISDNSNQHDNFSELVGNYNQTRKSTIIVCGSTQSKPLDIGIPVSQMPEEVFHGKQSPLQWLPMLTDTYRQTGSIILTIGRKAHGGKEYAVRLRESMAIAVKHLITLHYPQSLIIEGGATAFSILNALGWQQFEIENQKAPGVVTLLYHQPTNDVHITLKPGSYQWGNIF